MPSPSPGLREYQSGVAAEKRVALMRAARRVFLRDGYVRATVAAIATTAGISLATLYKHFPAGKAQIFEAVVAEGADTVVPAFERAAAPGAYEGALRGFVIAYGRVLAAPQTIEFFRIVIAETPKQPELGERWLRSGRAGIAERLRSLLEEARALKLLSVADVATAADELMASLYHALLWPGLLDPARRATPSDVERAADRALATFYARYGTKSQ
jgi:AcrR family transcriptional regulator